MDPLQAFLVIAPLALALHVLQEQEKGLGLGDFRVQGLRPRVWGAGLGGWSSWLSATGLRSPPIFFGLTGLLALRPGSPGHGAWVGLGVPSASRHPKRSQARVPCTLGGPKSSTQTRLPTLQARTPEKGCLEREDQRRQALRRGLWDRRLLLSAGGPEKLARLVTSFE